MGFKLTHILFIGYYPLFAINDKFYEQGMA